MNLMIFIFVNSFERGYKWLVKLNWLILIYVNKVSYRVQKINDDWIVGIETCSFWSGITVTRKID